MVTAQVEATEDTRKCFLAFFPTRACIFERFLHSLSFLPIWKVPGKWFTCGRGGEASESLAKMLHEMNSCSSAYQAVSSNLISPLILQNLTYELRSLVPRPSHRPVFVCILQLDSGKTWKWDYVLITLCVSFMRWSVLSNTSFANLLVVSDSLKSLCRHVFAPVSYPRIATCRPSEKEYNTN